MEDNAALKGGSNPPDELIIVPSIYYRVPFVYRQRIPLFHSGEAGSIPAGDTNSRILSLGICFYPMGKGERAVSPERFADITQWLECNLAKIEVVGSNPTPTTKQRFVSSVR